jgi:LysR family transcriptional regulator, hca operon transcriptional activator
MRFRKPIRDLEYKVGVHLFSRSVHGVELTAAGKAFLDHALLALAQVDAAVEPARRVGQPKRTTFAIGFQTGLETRAPDCQIESGGIPRRLGL